jgi:D-serine deaminase-like pyridoxal phosphate-dependent protein
MIAAELDAATAGLDPPFAILDHAALLDNAAELVRRAGGKPIRVASKSVRCRAVLAEVLALPGFRGILAYTVAEAIWLAEQFDDIVVGYPSAERRAIATLAADETLASRITLMIDDAEQLDLIDAAAPDRRTRLRVCCGAGCTSAPGARRCTGRAR